MPTSNRSSPNRAGLISRFRVGNHTYERCLVDCGKKNCSRCRPPDGRRPSHGPYWYLCFVYKGKWRRIYIGKNLSTTLFIDSDGRVDWTAIVASRSKEITKAYAPAPAAIDIKIPEIPDAGEDRRLEVHKAIKRIDRAVRKAKAAKALEQPGTNVAEAVLDQAGGGHPPGP